MFSLSLAARRRALAIAARLRVWLTQVVHKLYSYESASTRILGQGLSKRHARWETCKVCPMLSKLDFCKQCHCYVPLKIDAENAKCPQGKW